jgi:hypothetical protein
MDIAFFRDDGEGFGDFAPQTEFVYLTEAGESNFMAIVQMRGFLEDLSSADAEIRARQMWDYTRTFFNPPATLRDTPFDRNLKLTDLTELHFRLVPPQVAKWGSAKVTGQSVHAAVKEITAYLKLGRCVLSHSGEVGLLNHIVNTPARDALHTHIATEHDLGKPFTGTLYFRADFVDVAPVVHVAPDEPGRTRYTSWVDDANAFEAQASRAVKDLDFAAATMHADAKKLDQFQRTVEAIFDIGTLAEWRSVTVVAGVTVPITPQTQLQTYAKDCLKKLVTPSGPNGSFGFSWSLADLEPGKNFARYQTKKLEVYKQVADEFKTAPVAHVRLVTELCDLESEMIAYLAADGDPNKVVAGQLKSAIEWFGSGAGDPPAAAGGVGILLNMLNSPMPAGVPYPAGLLRLAMRAPVLYGIILAPERATAKARDGELKDIVTKLLGLSGEPLHMFKEEGGWDYLFSAAGVKKGTTAAIRALQLPPDMAKKLESLAKAWKVLDKNKIAAFRKTMLNFDDDIAWLRAIGFVGAGLNVLQDALQFKDGKFSDVAVKTLKDSISTFGSFARDFAATRMQLDPAFETLSEAERQAAKDALKTAGLARVGNAFGVVSGIWTLVNGVQKKDIILTMGGFSSMLGYGLRALAVELEISGLETGAVPLLVAGAVLEIWAALNPPAADDAVKDGAMFLVDGTTKGVGEWYAERYSSWSKWRAMDSPAFESALADVKKSASACKDTEWTIFLPYDADDRDRERVRFGEMGFGKGDAEHFIPDENRVKYWGRPSTPDKLKPPAWPPSWPKLEDKV